LAELPDAPKRATNVSLNSALLDQARALGINVSRACGRGLAVQIAEARAARQPFALVTQFLAAVPLAELRKPTGSLAAQSHLVVGALDMLLSGF
jgi:hypothetical protein